MNQIAIIGGGISGLTLAICLKKSGYTCYIYEKNAEFREVGAAISVFPNALTVYQEFGILNDILGAAGEVQDVFLKTPSGKILSQSKPRYALPTVCMHRPDLHAILLKHTDALLYTNHSLQTFTTLENGQVELVFTNGVRQTVDAVVGADGLNSVVREQLINDGKPVFRGYSIWRGVCQLDLAAGYGSETYGSGKRVGIVPIKDGVFGWWATLNEPFMQTDEPEGSKEKLLAHFGDWHYPIPQLIQQTEHFIKNSLSDRVPVRGWSKENIVLLGDAAHPTTPNLGQGGCMAIEGAYILARCIQKYGLNQSAFARYETLHFPRAKAIVDASLTIGKIGQSENWLVRAVRNALFRLLPPKLTLRMMDTYFSYDVRKLAI